MTENEMRPFAQNQLAATMSKCPDDDFLSELKSAANAGEVVTFDGASGSDDLSPDGFFDKVRSAVSEDARAIEQLKEAVEKGETVVVLDDIVSGEQATRAAQLLIDHGAGWIFHFDELTWTEMYSPTTRAAEADS